MKVLLASAALASAVLISTPTWAQNSAPGASVHNGAATSHSMNGGTAMNSGGSMTADSTMNHSTKMKKRHSTAAVDPMASDGVNVNSDIKTPGSKAMGNPN